MSEQEIFEILNKHIKKIQSEKDKPVRVAINGIEGTGKTVFAKKLTNYLNAIHINAIHISIDGFHFNQEIRYQQGRDSAKGYYENSYDEMTFVQKVLLSSQTDRPHYTLASHDLKTDRYLNLAPIYIEQKTVIITDGAYLFKPNYIEHWDLKIYLRTNFEIALKRGIKRDEKQLGGFEATKEKYKQRYHKASKMYLRENEPEARADIVIDNTHFDRLVIVKKIY